MLINSFIQRILIVSLISIALGDDTACTSVTPTSSEDCLNVQINTTANPSNVCCYVRRQVDLQILHECTVIDNSTSSAYANRISRIHEYMENSTQIVLDCGQSKELQSNCGPNNPKSPPDCSKTRLDGKRCCYVHIKRGDNTESSGCKVLPLLDINTIGEAVVAAKTLNVSLDVDCSSVMMNFSFFTLLFTLFLI